MNASKSFLEEGFGEIVPDVVGDSRRSVEASACFFPSFLDRRSGFSDVDRRVFLGSRGSSSFPLSVGTGADWPFRRGNSRFEL